MFTDHFAIIILSIAGVLSGISSLLDTRRIKKLERRVEELEQQKRFRDSTTLL